MAVEPALNDANHLFDLEGFEDVIVGALLHSLDSGLDSAKAGHDDREDVDIAGGDLLKQFDTTDPRHF